MLPSDIEYRAIFYIVQSNGSGESNLTTNHPGVEILSTKSLNPKQIPNFKNQAPNKFQKTLIFLFPTATFLLFRY